MRRAGNEKGLALVITLFITAILAVIIAEVVYSVHTHSFATGSYRDGQRASVLAQGGIILASGVIEKTMAGKAFTYLAPEDRIRAIAEGDTSLVLRVEDEEGKFNLNSIVYANGRLNDPAFETFERLLEELDLNPLLAYALADWIDENDEARPGGAESHDFYERQNPPYKAKNSKLDSVEELLFIKDYTHGAVNRLKPFVTVYSDGKVNLNSAPKELIKSLDAQITGEMAEKAIKYREETPFENTADIRKVSGFETIGFSLQGRIKVKSSAFRLFSKATAAGGVKHAEAVIDLRRTNRTVYFRER